jgi:hypothetical protein
MCIVAAGICGVAIIIAGIVAFTGSTTKSDSTSRSDAATRFNSTDQAFLDDVHQQGLAVTISDEAQVDLARRACESMESNFQNSTGNNTAEAIRLIYRETGLTGGDAISFESIAARYYCDRFYPGHY